MTDLPDLFGHTPAQADLFGGAVAPQPKREVDPLKVKLLMESMLAELRASRDGSPWPQDKLRLNRVIFPQMANWLPPEERDQLRFAFESELKRLDLAA